MFLKYIKKYLEFNTNNVQNLLDCLKLFEKSSELKVNNSKTQVIVFGIDDEEPSLVKTLNPQWCASFKLFGIQFDNTLKNMNVNYDKGHDKMKKIPTAGFTST